MKIKKLSLTNFRLHKSLEIDLEDSNNIVIVGNNASGKTTIVEAIYYCCFFTSFRIKKTEELITFNEDISSIAIEFEKDHNDMALTTYFNKEKRNIVYNGQKGQKRVDMMGQLKVLLLTPNSDELVSGSPRVRRNYLDMYISQFTPEYRSKLMQYQKLARQRAAALKANNPDMVLIDVITEQYDALAAELRSIRVEFTHEISNLSNSVVGMLSRGTDEVALSYKQSKKEDINREIRYGRNMYGLQYDDIEIALNNMPAKTFASQGQERSIAMALILSQIELIFNRYKEYPIVIIDDVHIELDKYRQEILFNLLNDRVQAFYVSTSLDNMPEKIKKMGIHYKLSRIKNEVQLNRL